MNEHQITRLREKKVERGKREKERYEKEIDSSPVTRNQWRKILVYHCSSKVKRIYKF